MGIDMLNVLLARKNQHFICTAAGQESYDSFTARITHKTTEGLSKEYIENLEKRIGHQNQLFELLSHYSSVRLYCDTLSDDSAFYIAHPDEWSSLEEGFKIWIEDLSEEERDELLPQWFEEAIVIGEIPFSGNYYLYPVKGEFQGKIFEFEHDGFEFIEVGKGIFSFLDYICTVTDNLIQNIQSHTRYSDGKTDIQWLAQSYSYDE